LEIYFCLYKIDLSQINDLSNHKKEQNQKEFYKFLKFEHLLEIIFFLICELKTIYIHFFKKKEPRLLVGALK